MTVPSIDVAGSPTTIRNRTSQPMRGIAVLRASCCQCCSYSMSLTRRSFTAAAVTACSFGEPRRRPADRRIGAAFEMKDTRFEVLDLKSAAVRGDDPASR